MFKPTLGGIFVGYSIGAITLYLILGIENEISFISGLLLYPIGLILIGAGSLNLKEEDFRGQELSVGLFSLFIHYYNLMIVYPMSEGIVLSIVSTIFFLNLGFLIVSAPSLGAYLEYKNFFDFFGGFKWYQKILRIYLKL